VDQIDLPIKPRFDSSELDRGIAKLKELQGQGFEIPIRFVTNLESIRNESAAVVARMRAEWNSFSADLTGSSSRLAAELDRLGETNFASRIRAGFRSATEELLVLSNALDLLAAKQLPGSELARSLAAARVTDLTAQGTGAADKASFAGYSAEVDKAATAQGKFSEVEKIGAAAAAQSKTALAAQEQVLRTKGAAFEQARAAAEKFTRTEAEQAAQAKQTAAAAQQTATGQAALIRSRYENGKLIDQTFARGPGTTERVLGADTVQTVDRLKAAKSAMADVLDKTRLQVDANKAAGGSAADLNNIYRAHAAELKNLAMQYADLERTRQTSFGRTATRLEGAGANAIAGENARVLREQQSAAEALQRQRSQALIRQAREEERLAASGGLRGLVGTVGTAATFIGVYQGIDVGIRALKAGAEASVEFERKLATLSVVFRGTREESRDLAHDVLSVAASFGQDGIAALDVATDFARFGGTAAEVLEAVRVVSMAANVAQITLQESSKDFQGITAGYSLQAGQLAAVLGSLNTISNTYQVTVKQMLDGLARVAPLAKQAGIGLTELMGFEAVITGRTQRPGAEAGQALKSLIVRLNKPETQAALETAGISPTDRNGELKTASQLINELYLAYNRLGAAEREELLIKVAGTFQAARVAALLDGYVTSQLLAVRASRDLTSSDRENLRVRETLSSQLGTLRTQWEAFWSAAAAPGGVQAELAQMVANLSKLLALMTTVQTVSSKASGYIDRFTKRPGAAPGEAGFLSILTDLGTGKPPGISLSKQFAQDIPTHLENLAKKIGLGDTFKSDSDKAAEALIRLNGELEKTQKLAEADEAATRVFATIAASIERADAEKLEEMLRAIAELAGGGDRGREQEIYTEVKALAEAHDWRALNAKLSDYTKMADADRTKHMAANNAKLDGEIARQRELLDIEVKKRDARPKTDDNKDADEESLKKITAAQTAIAALQTRKSTNFRDMFPADEDVEIWKSAGIDDKKRHKLEKDAEEIAKILGTRPKTTHVAELDEEADRTRLGTELLKQKIRVMQAAGQVSADAAKAIVADLEKERDATLETIQARRQFASIIDTQEQATRRIKDQTDAYGEATKAIPSVNRADELGAERQVLQIKDDMLRLERAREEPMLRALGLGQAEIDIALANIDAQRQLVTVEGERLAQQQRFAAIVDAAKKGVKEAQATNEFFGVGQNDSEKRANLIRGLTDRRSGRDLLTGLPLNIAAATADFAGAADPVEKARALARLKEMAISLQDAENDLIKRRYQLEAEITNERRKQAQEASKNLLMADREIQLRAALAAKFAQGRGGRGFTAEEFGFFDTKTKQTIEKTNPDLLPPEFQTRLRELQDESIGLANAFRPLKEAADAAAAAIAQLRLPTPAINPGNPSAAVSIDVSPVSAAIANSGHGVQTAIDVLGTNMVRQLDSITAALDMVSVNLGTRVARLEAGSLTSQIGRAQGAASVLA
jgi:TP901 family phage tail tape measure protein